MSLFKTDSYYGGKYPIVEKTWGYRANQQKDYYRTGREYMFIVAHRFDQEVLSRAIHRDFGFTTNGTIDKRAWALRGIKYRASYKKNLLPWIKSASSRKLGCVFVICGPRVHRPAVYLNRDKHLVLLTPPITRPGWHELSIFKQAAEYLNIDKDIFRPY